MPMMMKKLSYRKQVARKLRTQYVEGMIKLQCGEETMTISYGKLFL